MSHNAKVHFRVSRQELLELKQCARNAKCTVSEVVRKRLQNSAPSPPRRFDGTTLAEEINAVGRKIDAVAAQGNTLGWVDRDAYKYYVAEFYKLLERTEQEFNADEKSASDCSLAE